MCLHALLCLVQEGIAAFHMPQRRKPGDCYRPILDAWEEMRHLQMGPWQLDAQSLPLTHSTRGQDLQMIKKPVR